MPSAAAKKRAAKKKEAAKSRQRPKNAQANIDEKAGKNRDAYFLCL